MNSRVRQEQPPHSRNIYDTYDAFDDDDILPGGSPPMKALRPRLTISPSPPPDIPAARVSSSPPSTSVDFQRSNRPKILPRPGDFVLVAHLDDGRHPEIARAAGFQALPGVDEEQQDDAEEDKGDGTGDVLSILSGHRKEGDACPVDTRFCGSAPTLSSDINRPSLQHLAADALQVVSRNSEPRVLGGEFYDITYNTRHLSLHDDRSSTNALPPHRNPPESNAISERLGKPSFARTSDPGSPNDTLPPIYESPPIFESNSQNLPSIHNILEDEIFAQLSALADRANDIVPRGSESPFTQSPSRTPAYLCFPSNAEFQRSPMFTPNEDDARSCASPYSLYASSPHSRHTSSGRSQGLSTESGTSQRSETPGTEKSAKSANIVKSAKPARIAKSAKSAKPAKITKPGKPAKPAKPAKQPAKPAPARSSPVPIAAQMRIDGVTNPSVGRYPCTFGGCQAAPFQTRYLLNSHKNVHSSARPHYCPVSGCSRSEGDNLQRHVRMHHVDKDKDDPLLREVLSQRSDGPNRGRRRRGIAS
ncbi:hypothetical protein E4U55_007691 [Claviceps digitariae]|nr:hypothetical protein E4U55_007691 [Claviceps digitariae]